MARKKGKPLDRRAFLRQATTPKERSKEQEERIAFDFGGKVQPGSGNVQGYKGDIDDVPDISLSIGTFKIEAKITIHSSYRINMGELQKIETEAIMEGKRGCMVITLEDQHDYIVIRKDYLEGM